MEIDDKENVMENLQAVIDRKMAAAQTTFAKDWGMQETLFEDAANAFAVKSFIEGGMIEKAAERFAQLDTVPREEIFVALEQDKGREWAETIDAISSSFSGEGDE